MATLHVFVDLWLKIAGILSKRVVELNCFWIYGSNLKLRRNNLNSPEDSASFSYTYPTFAIFSFYFHILMLIQIMSHRVWKTTSLNLMRLEAMQINRENKLDPFLRVISKRQSWVLDSRPEIFEENFIPGYVLLEHHLRGICFFKNWTTSQSEFRSGYSNDVSQIVPPFLMTWILFLPLALQITSFLFESNVYRISELYL